MAQQERAAVYAGTKNYYKFMIPAVKSLLMNSNVDKVYLLIEDKEFPYELPDCVQCIDVSNQRFFRQNGPNMNSRYTYMALMKVTYAKLFPQYDRILSLDVDTIVVDDISELWDLKLDGIPGTSTYYMAGVREPYKSRDGYLYINSGVLMFNLKALRETHMDQTLIDVLNEIRYTFPEQDAINKKCQGRMLMIPEEYNFSMVSDETEEPKIFHYAVKKDWTMMPEYVKYENTSWNDVMARRNVIRSNTKYEKRENGIDYYLGEDWKAKTSHLKQDSI